MGFLKINQVDGITVTRKDGYTGDGEVYDLPIGVETERLTVNQLVTVYAKIGFEIVTAKWSAGAAGSGNMTLADNKKSATQNANVTYQGDTNYTFTITTKVVPVPKIEVFGNDISATVECKSFSTGKLPIPINETYIAQYSGWSYEVVATVDEGFTIVEAEYIKATGSDGFMTISPDGKTAIATRVVDGNITFTCNIVTESEIPPPPTGIIRVEGSNISATGEDITDGSDIPVEIELNTDINVEAGKTYEIVVTVDDGYEITYAGYVKASGSDGFMNISPDKTTATISRVVNETVPFVCDVDVALIPPPPPEIKLFNETETISVTATNKTTNEIISVPYNTEIKVNGLYDYKIIALPVDGYKIIYGSYTRYSGSTGQLEPKVNGSLEVDIIGSQYVSTGIRFDIEATTIEEQPPQKVSGFNHLYLVDNDILKQLASERFEIVGTETNDLGQYIINVMELPFKLKSNQLGIETRIVLGYKLMNTEAIELLNDELIIDFGEIEIPLKYNNSYDYMNTVVKLHVPYADSIEVDINYIINQTIRIVYIIDLYSGETTINIYSSLIENIFHSATASIGRNIPFLTTIKGEKMGSLSDNRSLMNGLLKPFVEVIRNVPYQVDNLFNSDVVVQGTILNVLGFIRVDDMILNSNATINEKQRILNILKSGVFIK